MKKKTNQKAQAKLIALNMAIALAETGLVSSDKIQAALDSGGEEAVKNFPMFFPAR